MKADTMTSMRTLALASALALPLAWSLPAAAQTTTPAAATPMGRTTPTADMAEGEIRKISKDSGKLTIKHGPIKNLDMPPMTMVFTAQDPAMLASLAVGDKVRFVVVDQDGQMVVTAIQRAQ